VTGAEAAVVRSAEPTDVDALIALYIEFHEHHVRHLPDRLRSPSSYQTDALRDRLSELMSDPERLLLVIEAGKTLVDFAEASVEDEPPDDAIVPRRFAHLQSLWVAPEVRASGWGRALSEAAERWASSVGAVEMRLDVWEYVESPETFYRKLGYRPFRHELVKPLA